MRTNFWSVCRGWNPKRLRPSWNFMGKKPIPLETIADNSIIDRLVREGFIEKLYKKR
jgi:hypothetical protein